MMNKFLKVSSIAMIILGIVKTFSGDSAAGFVLIVSGCIVDLQLDSKSQHDRIQALEQKDKKDAT